MQGVVPVSSQHHRDAACVRIPLSRRQQARTPTEHLCCSCIPSCLSPQVGDGVFEVLSTSGDTHLGGDDFDKRIVDFLAGDFQKNEGIDLRKDRCVCVDRQGVCDFVCDFVCEFVCEFV